VYVLRMRGKIVLALSYTPGHEESREKGGINFRYSSRYQMGVSNELHAPAVLSTERDLGAHWIGDGVRLRDGPTAVAKEKFIFRDCNEPFRSVTVLTELSSF
jgi:hypothetical protein